MKEKTNISKIEKLKAKQEAIKAEIIRIEAKEKHQDKKEDTRRKILVGSYYLEKAKENGGMSDLKKQLDTFLTRKSDRKLFGLKKI